jgi:hypothetical protein
MYSVRKIFSFTVGSDFPKITKNELPLGVYNTSYFIELSAAEKFITVAEEIIQKI